MEYFLVEKNVVGSTFKTIRRTQELVMKLEIKLQKPINKNKEKIDQEKCWGTLRW